MLIIMHNAFTCFNVHGHIGLEENIPIIVMPPVHSHEHHIFIEFFKIKIFCYVIGAHFFTSLFSLLLMKKGV